MRSHALSLPFAFSLSVCLSNAIRVPITRHKLDGHHQLRRRGGTVPYARPVVDAATSSSGSNDGLDLTTVDDLLYIANITLAGAVYPVQLDTGSSDLWVKPPSSPIPHTNVSSITYNMTYGIGWAYGNVSYGTVEFAGVEVASQAFMDVSDASNPALSYGADGIIGLGFDSLSTVDALVNRTGASTGRTFLYNAFAQNKSEPNFISFSLQDDADPDDTVQGFFSIGEYDPKYTAVDKSYPISTWPESYPTRWSVLLDALLVGDEEVTVSSTVSGAPSNRAVVVLDSGTSYTYAPTEICNAIYGGVSGANYEPSLGQWVVPCDAEVDIALQFGDSVYPINPLDMTPQDPADTSKCVGTFIPQTVSVGAGQFDWLIGDNVLRSVYTVYDFGDYDSSGNRGNPYIKLLPLVDPDEASVAFHSIRGGTPENITYNAANVSSDASGSTTVSLSDDLVSSLNRVSTFLPAVLALMAFNALLLIAIIAGGVVYFLRRRSRTRTRKTPGRSSPMPMTTMSTYGLMSGDPSHAYQPVSMALTEDSFVPPSPAFSRPGYQGEGLRSPSIIERPKSVA
ncbi:uncharacterized protein FIBRA_06987 [Fibroporia radiculosa]|uniref:Peptidase A1 domain-containing protein n=1 Tax=Fibroporia radiculosa TaxID=599839 RepID=J4H4D3_9APHY|nr:uncharacterized protein FIBRA_06987 [Fibroporia radiculosa]CCM04794.1 predicted protein [Fibroporia radiculosa]